MNDTDHQQQLGAQPVNPPQGQENHIPLAATAAVRRMLLQDPPLHSLLAMLAQPPGESRDPTFGIHRQLEETTDQNIVVRWFPKDPLPLAMTEAQSFRHFGPHHPPAPPRRSHCRQATLGWGIAKAVDSPAVALILVALIAAVTLCSNPQLVTR